LLKINATVKTRISLESPQVKHTLVRENGNIRKRAVLKK